MTVDHPSQYRDDFRALDLASARARQFRISEAQDADAIVRVQSDADLLEMIAQPFLDRTPTLTLGVSRYRERRDLLALGDLQSDNRQFFNIGRAAVDLFQLVYVDVVAAGIDDYVLGAADDEEPAFVVEASKVSGVKPALLEYFVGSGLVAIVAEHHVGTARDNLTDIAAVLHVQLDLDAAQRLSDRAQCRLVFGTRNAKDRRRFRKPVALEQLDTDIVEELRDTLRQGCAAADSELEPATQSGMRLAKNNIPEIEMIIAVEAPIQITQPSERSLKKRPACVDLVHDSAMDGFPQGWYADQRRWFDVGQCARQAGRIDTERIDDSCTAGQRQQHPAGELKCVMQR